MTRLRTSNRACPARTRKSSPPQCNKKRARPVALTDRRTGRLAGQSAACRKHTSVDSCKPKLPYRLCFVSLLLFFSYFQKKFLRSAGNPYKNLSSTHSLRGCAVPCRGGGIGRHARFRV